MMIRTTGLEAYKGLDRKQGEEALIEDYKLEELLRCPSRYLKRKADEEAGAGVGAMLGTEVSWQQLVQYSVCHMVNDYYSLPPEHRSEYSIERSADRRWTNRTYKFDSADHYWQVRYRAVSALKQLLHGELDGTIRPLIVFESYRTHIEAVQAEISFIVQVLYRPDDRPDSPYVIRKYLVDDDPDVIAGFRHLAVLFCSEAFEELPGRIEVFGVLSGSKHVFRPQADEVAKAADYIRLLREYARETETAAQEEEKTGHVHRRRNVCRKCRHKADYTHAGGSKSAKPTSRWQLN